MLKLTNIKIAQQLPEDPRTELRPGETYGEPGLVDEENYEGMLPDEVDIDELEEAPELPPVGPQTGIPMEAEEVPYDIAQKLAYDGIDNENIISFNYVTRHGIQTGPRVVEPHYTFLASTTGNEVLVGWDRTMNDIRSYILPNITPLNLYPQARFEPKPEIMGGVM